MVTRWYAYDLLVSILIGLVPEEDVYGAIVKHNDELVRVLAFNHGFKPPDMLDFPILFHLLTLVVLYNDTLVL